jgi:hypothetical protein
MIVLEIGVFIWWLGDKCNSICITSKHSENPTTIVYLYIKPWETLLRYWFDGWFELDSAGVPSELDVGEFDIPEKF